ncbi:hypothetical protein TIFTF001_053134 [Ficus carica]|uniref:Uncharacterized protein n=1 Tax=Ficus carica TaxID=3494 RepID=A0AA88EFY8_FICCA|nr:hypothetical protein TIFTF001_053134 [Ficus carica]
MFPSPIPELEGIAHPQEREYVLTKPMMLSWSLRMISHTRTETRPELPWRTAVENSD